MKQATRLLNYEAAPGDAYRPSAPPLYQTATFAQPSATEGGPYDYTRSGNPTRDLLQERIADLEGGGTCSTFASGMAAVAAVLRLCEVGDRVLCGDDLYGGTFRWLERCAPRAGISVQAVDLTDLEAVRVALAAGARLVLVETPTNPLQRIVDVRALAALAHDVGAWLAVDNSLLSPYLQAPLDLGADLAILSTTKHLSGHADCTGGAVTTRNDELAAQLAFHQNAEGTGLAPFEAWLLLRGMQTLGVRIEHAQRGAEQLAHWLESRPEVPRVHYAGLASHPGAALHASQARGAGSVISFSTGDAGLSRRLIEGLRLFHICVSFGSARSTISLPCAMSHASIPASVRDARGLAPDLVRISVGLEAASDLERDLARGLEGARPTSRERQLVPPRPNSADSAAESAP